MQSAMFKWMVCIIAVIALIPVSCSSKKEDAKKKEARTTVAKDKPNKEQLPTKDQEIVFPEDLSGIKSYAMIQAKGPSGEEYVFKSTELVFTKDSRAFSDAAMNGTGQLLHSEGNDLLLLTGGRVTLNMENRLSLQFADKQVEIEISKGNRVCDGQRPIDLSKIVVGEMVVMVSQISTPKTAISVRRGPMLLMTGGTIDSGHSSTPVNYMCKEQSKK